MFRKYLKSIGISLEVGDTKLNTIVETAFKKKPQFPLKPDEVRKLYIYTVPEMSPDGSCSLVDMPAKEPYDLRLILRISSTTDLSQHPHTSRLWRLNQIIQQMQTVVAADWIGIYRKTNSVLDKPVLVKEAYHGSTSRAEFPLTEDFAKKSNNSTVGLTGKAVVINSVQKHAGPYYVCDNAVNSEFCLPILDKDQEVIGIIDSEAFTENFFTSERLLQIAKVAYDLGQHQLGIFHWEADSRFDSFAAHN